MKFMTEGEAETKRQKAVEFLRRIGQDDDADRFDDMTAAEYAENKGAELLDNPHRRKPAMPKNRTQLQTELEEANEYIEELEAKLDEIAGLASGEEDEDEDADEGEE